MAYADSIRSATCSMADVATLIEGIASSGYPLTWTDWTPTYGAGGSMTFTSVTTTRARYCRIGKLICCDLSCTGTTGGSASNYLTISTPVAASANFHGFNGYVSDTAAVAGLCYISSSTMYVLRYDAANFGLGASRGIHSTFVYEAA